MDTNKALDISESQKNKLKQKVQELTVQNSFLKKLRAEADVKIADLTAENDALKAERETLRDEIKANL
jgi:peptidoglycan hydrolase CwlO-like protein